MPGKTAIKVRRFEDVAGTSEKFWEVEIQDTKVNVRYGRKGSSGQAETKSFAAAAKAAKFVQRKIREKLAKGYQEVG